MGLVLKFLPLIILPLILGAVAIYTDVTTSGGSRDEPGTILVVGDSIVSSAFANHDRRFTSAAPRGYEVVVDAFMGQETTDHTTIVRQFATRNQPSRLVIELGTNDAFDRGWTDVDAANYAALLDATPPRTCVTVVLPAVSPDGVAFKRAATADASAAIRRLVASRPNRRVVDFAAFQEAHPTFIASDGIHLRTDGSAGTDPDEVLDTYRDWLWSAVDRCVEHHA
jgi:hypothetical protein